MRIPPVHFLDYATDCINKRGVSHRAVSEATFKAHFKLTPNGCTDLYFKLQMHGDWNECDTNWEDCEPRHLLWALYHMFTYVSEEIGKTFFGVLLSTYRKYVHAMMCFLAEATFDMVSWYHHKTL